jgi:ABC-type transport system involved in multi-copper enzyme maturation permease subunit
MSPIHDQSYRRYEGKREPLGRSWSVITGAGIRSTLSRKALIALLIVSWIPFVVRTVQIYVVSAYAQASQVVPVDAKMFRDFIEYQGIFVFFVTVFVGAGLIASDRRANALQIYLSKPLLRMEYIGGKLAILVTFLLFVTLLPGLLLIILQVLFAGNLDFLRANLYVIPAVVLSSLMRVLVAAFTMLALSALSKSTRYVAILYTGAIFFTNSMFVVLRIITNSTRAAWVSITANLDVVTDVMFRQTARYDTPVIVSVLVLAGLVAISVSVLERRVKGVEVVK